MRTRSLLPLLALGFGLAASAAAPAPAADKAEKPDAARIGKLVTQLGSDDFDDREKASAELGAIGEPALDALRQAVKSTDEEVHKRAETLVSAIEKRLEARNALVPKRVHLVYKDTPVKEAVEDFAKKSGYALTLYDPDGKLKDRTVTLDTGDVTFWQAFDQFCAKAGLKEAGAGDLPQPDRAPAPAPGVRAPAVAPGGAIQPKTQPAPAPQPTPQGAVPLGGAAPPANVPAVPAAPPAVGAPAPPPGAVLIGGFGLAPVPGAPTTSSDAITLVDGKVDALPTDASSAVRVQALPKADQFGPAPDGELQVGLRLSLEPKLQWQGVDKITVTKASDDQKQDLTQTSTDATPANPVGAPAGGPVFGPVPIGQGGARQDVLVHLKKGDKAAKSLTELAGTITATVLGETTPVITATEILKANGKVFKGGENGQIKINDVSKTDVGQITIHVELQAPTDVVPVGGGGPVGPIWRRPIRRVPLPVPAPAVPGAAPAAVGVAIVIGPGGFGPAMNGAGGLGLVDEKGEPIKQISLGLRRQVVNGVAFHAVRPDLPGREGARGGQADLLRPEGAQRGNPVRAEGRAAAVTGNAFLRAAGPCRPPFVLPPLGRPL